MASPTPNIGMTYPVRGGSVGTWDTPVDTNFDTLDSVLAGTVAVAAAGTGATLTQTQANNRRISITGVLAQNYLMSFPPIGGLWVVANNTTGAFTVTLNVTGSVATALTVNQSETALVSSNGTDLFVGNTQGNTWAGATYAGTDVSPTSFSTDQNNYNPTNLSTATCLRLNATAACSVTGLAGGAASRDLEIVNIGTATIKFPANSGSSSAANQFANTFNLFPGQTIFLRYDATSSLWRPKNVATAYSSCAIAAVSNDLSITNTATPNTIQNISASEAVLVDASGNAIKFESISVTIDTTTTGPGGCDTGTRAATKEYYSWLCSNGVVINAVASLSSSAATVLTNLSNSGFASYIYFKRVGATFTDGSSNLKKLKQTGGRSQYINTGSGLPIMGQNVSTTSLTAISVTGYVPATALVLHYVVAKLSGTGGAFISPNSTYTAGQGANTYDNCTPNAPTCAGSMVLEGTNIYVGDSAGNGTNDAICAGWTDAI